MSIHPEINSLIKKRDMVFDYLHVQYNPEKALNIMEGMLRELESKHRPEELINKIRDEREKLRKMENRSQKTNRISQMIHIYSDWLEELNDTLWDNDYLYNKRYGGPDRKQSKIRFEE